jgi:hypothetical protein
MILGMTTSTDRYIVKRGDKPGQWQVYDTRANAPAFGAESMTEAMAIERTRQINLVYSRAMRHE